MKKKTGTKMLIASSVVLFAAAGLAMMQGEKTQGISVKQAYEMIRNDTNVVLLDVRTRAEYDASHLANTLLIPVQELAKRVDELEAFKEKTIIAYCRSGNRSGRAATFLKERGFKVQNLEGGIVKWKEENLPVVTAPQ